VEETVGKTCPIRKRCHARSAVERFGTKFSSQMVVRLASSSALLIQQARTPGVKQESDPLLGEPEAEDTSVTTHPGSGTLIWPNVVLCAAHTVQTVFLRDLQFLFLFECDARTAPGAGEAYTSCEKLETTAQATPIKVLETGYDDGLDYALIAIRWIDLIVSVGFLPASSRGGVERRVVIPRPSFETRGELLAVGHPIPGEPTQAAAGKLISNGQAHPEPAFVPGQASREYGYANFETYYGMSGGGVFNEAGDIVGVVIGDTLADFQKKKKKDKKKFEEQGLAFLNLGLAARAGKSAKRIRQWLGSGPPLLSGDPKPTLIPPEIIF
jgi:Trypsin-like peptidase domain